MSIYLPANDDNETTFNKPNQRKNCEYLVVYLWYNNCNLTVYNETNNKLLYNMHDASSSSF